MNNQKIRKLGYQEALDAWKDWTPVDGFKTAGHDEEILQSPATHIFVAVEGAGEVFVNGQKILPKREYPDAKVYEQVCISYGPAGKEPGILSLKLSNGTRYRYYATDYPEFSKEW